MRVLTERIKESDIKPNMFFVAQAGDGRMKQNQRGSPTGLQTEGYIENMFRENQCYRMLKIHINIPCGTYFLL